MTFFFSSRRRHTILQGDWSSDVCSSDLLAQPVAGAPSAGACTAREGQPGPQRCAGDRKSTRLNSSHLVISYAVFCLKKKKKNATSLLGWLESHISRAHNRDTRVHLDSII